MFINSQKAEEQAILNLAYAVCAAVRTAPKACGIDHIDTAILTGEEKKKVADEMRRLGETIPASFFIRDAGNVDASGAIVLVGTRYETRGLNERCGLCGFADCTACTAAGAACVFTGVDLGIALGSAVSIAADARIDNRVMFTIGKAAASLRLMGEHKLIMGIPLSVSGKSPFFDRKLEVDENGKRQNEQQKASAISPYQIWPWNWYTGIVSVSLRGQYSLLERMALSDYVRGMHFLIWRLPLLKR